MNQVDLNAKSRSWWNANPMTYDWHGTLEQTEGTPEFFDAVDRRFLESHYFAQEPGAPPFSRLIPYERLAGRRVVEVGCGAGAITAEFARQGAVVAAIDMADRSVALTRARMAVSGLQARVIQGNAERLPFADASVDYVWSWGVLHHAGDTAQTIRELHRVLRPGGRAAVMLYNRASFRYWVHLLLIRGVLMGKLLRMSVQELVTCYTDGAVARHFTRSEAESLFSCFGRTRMRLYGLKTELVPVPASRAKALLLKLLPERAASAVLARVGWFLFIEAEK